MTELWYERIIRAIIDANADLLFVIDPHNLTEYSKIEEIIGETYLAIERYTNELTLRRIIRSKAQKIALVFRDSSDIPFDLISTYATMEIGIDAVFPLLNTEALLNIPYDNYQEIYEEYNKLRETHYERLSKQETEDFIHSVLSSETILKRRRFTELRSRLDQLIDASSENIRDWARITGEIAHAFGELMFITHTRNMNQNTEDLKTRINRLFKRYAIDYDYYKLLAYDPGSRVNSNLIGTIFKNRNVRAALICFDCMGFEEWYAIKTYLEGRINLVFTTQYSFSMLPSETNYSSSALFAGLTPKDIEDLDFINDMHWKNEKRLFQYALNERLGIDETRIYFQRCADPGAVTISFDSFRDYRALGFVFSFIDRFIHAPLMDKRTVIKNIQMHLGKSKLDKLIRALLDQGFDVYFASDHGSIFSRGNGINVSKDLVDSQAKRYLIGAKELLEEYKTDDSVLIQLKNILGDDFVLLLTGDTMFARKNEQGLTHGGISVEEVVVPFIEVKYDDRI